MNTKPILFCGAMVRAILDGSKTQTRRLSGLEVVNEHPDEWTFMGYCQPDGNAVFMKGTEEVMCCPRYPVDTMLWVKEAYRLGGTGATVFYRADDGQKYIGIPDSPIRASWFTGHWCSSMFMPRQFSRITLEVTAVRVQRVSEISEEDAKEEGVAFGSYLPWEGDPDEARKLYAALWDSLNGKKHPWASNPWVFAYTFRRVKP